MHSACRAIAFCGLLLTLGDLGYGQSAKPTASQLEALERFAKQPAAKVTWSREVDRIEADQARAVVTALIVEDAAEPPKRVRGVRIDLVDGNAKDQVYASEEHLERLIKALDEISNGLPSFLARAVPGERGCFGSGEFWMQQGHALSASHLHVSGLVRPVGPYGRGCELFF